MQAILTKTSLFTLNVFSPILIRFEFYNLNTTKMMSSGTSSLKFSVTRKNIELVGPEKPTPYECKLLSDIDDQPSLQFHVPVIQFYGSSPFMEGKDPVKVIKESLAKALVFYYPFAGRARELPGRKLMVECTGEGVLFVEANADVKLEDFGEDDLHPPSIPCLDELLYDVPGSSVILNSPLLLIQVTRLACGGFIVATRLNHAMSDAFGLQQFMTAISEIAKGATSPSILPVWQRELLSARSPPRITHVHPEYDHIQDTNNSVIPQNKLINRSFFFGPKEISILRKLVMLDSQNKYSSFNLVAACVWRCRTIALQYHPSDEVRFLCLINARVNIHPPLVCMGYYGNAFVFPAGISTAGDLGKNRLAHAAEIISKIKSQVTKEYVQSVADLMVLKGRPSFSCTRTYMVSDNTKAGFENVDYGWGKAVYGGVSVGDFVPGVSSFYIPFERKKKNDGKGILVPISLEASTMERFEKELWIMLNNGDKIQTSEGVTFKCAL